MDSQPPVTDKRKLAAFMLPMAIFFALLALAAAIGPLLVAGGLRWKQVSAGESTT